MVHDAALEKALEKARLKKEREERLKKNKLYLIWAFLLANPIIFTLIISGVAVGGGLATFSIVKAVVEEERSFEVSLVKPPEPEEEPEEEDEPKEQEKPDQQPEPEPDEPPPPPDQPQAPNSLDELAPVDSSMFNPFGGVLRGDTFAGARNSGTGIAAAGPASEPAPPPAPAPAPPPPAPVQTPAPVAPAPRLASVPNVRNQVRVEDYIDARNLGSGYRAELTSDLSGQLEYPEVARRGGIQGTVNMEVDINQSGQITNARNAGSVDIVGLTDEALSSIEQIEALPPTIDGERFDYRNVDVQATFELK